MSDEQNAKQFEIKESVTVGGITADYVWYNATLLRNKMSAFTNSWVLDFERVVKVMENRHDEHLEIIKQLLVENHELKRKVKKDE